MFRLISILSLLWLMVTVASTIETTEKPIPDVNQTKISEEMEDVGGTNEGEESRTAKIRSLTNRMLMNVRCTFYQKAVIPMTKLFNLSVPMPQDIPEQCQQQQMMGSLIDNDGGQLSLPQQQPMIITTVMETPTNQKQTKQQSVATNQNQQNNEATTVAAATITTTTTTTAITDVEIPIKDKKFEQESQLSSMKNPSLSAITTEQPTVESNDDHDQPKQEQQHHNPK